MSRQVVCKRSEFENFRKFHFYYDPHDERENKRAKQGGHRMVVARKTSMMQLQAKQQNQHQQ